MAISSIADLVHHIDQGGMVALRGIEELARARAVLEHATQVAGYGLAFDPESAGDLVDYLTVSGVSGLEGAIAGASIGAVVGLLVDRSGNLAKIGLTLGFLAGIAHGIHRVQHGWRIRALREADGTPCVTIHSLGSTYP